MQRFGYIQYAVIVAALHVAAGDKPLHCWSCTYSKMDSDNKFLGPILDLFGRISNTNCLLEDIEKDKYKVDIRECKQPHKSSGEVAMCADLKGIVHTDVEVPIPLTDQTIKINVQYHTVERGCITAPKGDKDYIPGEKHHYLPSSGTVRSLLAKSIEGADVGEIEFDGEAEYHLESNVKETAMKCYHCTYNEVITDNRFLQWVIDGISLLSSDSCLLDDAGKDAKYNVDIRNCEPPVSTTKMTKCATVDGQVTGSFLGVNVIYKTLKRDCSIVPRDDPNYEAPQAAALTSDGCHHTVEVPSKGTSSYDLISHTNDVSGISLDDFDGNVCYYTQDLGGVGSGQITTPSIITMFVTLIIMVALCHRF